MLSVPHIVNLDGPENYVNSIEFDIACAEKARELPRQLAADYGDFFDNLWSDSDSASTAPADVESPHEPCKLEAHFYYSGISIRSHCPRLVYRDSDDVFEEPVGPDNRVREMKLVHVPETHEFAHNGLWEKVRDWVRFLVVITEILDSRFHTPRLPISSLQRAFVFRPSTLYDSIGSRGGRTPLTTGNGMR